MSLDAQDNPLAELRYSLLNGDVIGETLPDSEQELRELLEQSLSSHEKFCVWKRLRQLGVVPTDDESAEILGVVGEVGTDNGSAMAFGLSDGSASMYTSTGGGFLGGSSDENVRNACSQLIQAAKPFASLFPVVEEFPYPQPQVIRLAVMTPHGVRSQDLPEAELTPDSHQLWPLFSAWNGLVTQLRLIDPSQRTEVMRAAGFTYMNCLLTLMWEKSLPPVTITDEERPPDLREFAVTPDDHEFIDRIGMPPQQVDPDAIRAALCWLAGFRWYHFFRTRGTVRTKMAIASPDETFDVSFTVEKSRDVHQRHCVVVTRSP